MDRIGPFSESTFQVTYGASAFGNWQNGNPAVGDQGSIPGHESWTHMLAELVHLIEHAGLVPDKQDLQQVRKAVEAKITALTGGGDVSEYLTLLIARARLPIFPEIQTADGRMNVSSPGAGTILVPPAVSFQHRGIYPVSTSDYPEVDRTFATAVSKTYHLRWAYGSGFSLTDVSDPTYNPTALAEADRAFDSTYDDMLIARVVTSSSNVATITNLANKTRLRQAYTRAAQYTGQISGQTNGQLFLNSQEDVQVNFGRTPDWFISGIDESLISGPLGDGGETNLFAQTLTRYSVLVVSISSNVQTQTYGRPGYSATLLAV